MNELILYKIIEAILKQSVVIAGRFVVCEGYGNDLNANNYNDVIKDALDNYKYVGLKYPVSVLMPPMEVIESHEKGWSRFKLEQFFLCTTGYTGTHEIKGLNSSTNTSEHSIMYDWKDMRECAGNFRKMFNQILREKGYLNYINSATTPDFIRRVSNMGNDKLSGVVITYEINIAMPCTMADYPPAAISNIILPTITDIHPLHKH
jgi:hypothetical protein